MENLVILNDIAYDNGGQRAFGFPGYDASVDFIYGELEKLDGFKFWKQDFPALFVETQSISVEVGGEDLEPSPLTYSPSTSEEGETLTLVHGPEGEDGCSEENYEGLGADGKIVLVERGLCPDGSTFAGKVKPAAAAGAVAVVIYNSDPSTLTGGTLSEPNEEEFVPAALINQAPGLDLKARLDANETVEVYFQLTQIIEERVTQNVFAETEEGDGDNVVILGAHLDSVQAGPGINDDGSGCSLILELAKALTRYSTKLKVRFAWWGAEENGLLGSEYYCENLSADEADDVLAYLNFDMVSRGYFGVFDGDGSTHGLPGPPGSDAIERIFVDDMTAKGVNVTPAVFTMGSDYASFWEVLNKPVGGLHTGTGVEQDPCYHLACDNITNVVPETLTTNAKAAAHALSVLAMEGDVLIPKDGGNGTNGTVVGAVNRARSPVTVDFDRLEAMGERHLRTCGHDV